MTLEQKVALLIIDVEKLKKKSAYQTEWLTKSEFKELTGIESDGTIYQLINKKAFTVRERGKRRFNRASVVEWMGEKKSKSELSQEYNKKLRAA